MTVDVEDYFQVTNFEGVVSRDSWASRECRVEDNTTRLLDLFAAANMKATFFVLAWVAERFPGLVRRIAADGHEIASHGYWHQLIHHQTPEAFRDDVRTAKALLEDTTGTAVVGYRAPSFSVTRRTLWALDVLLEEGHTYDSSIVPVRHNRYGIPGTDRHAFAISCGSGTMIEVPVSTGRVGGVQLLVGGAYFRFMPYAWTEGNISRMNAEESRPAVFYVHPWEIDPAQPRLPASPLSRIRHYHNLGATEPRLRRLLGRFRFGTVRQLVESLPALPPRSLDSARP